MRRRSIFVPLIATIALGACASVAERQIGTVTVDGEDFPVVSRTIQGQNGPFDTAGVKVYGKRFTCRPQSAGDCEAAARRGLEVDIFSR
ncbi:hypothetical protein [Roseobacter sp.]|uniref:hypothetical protein n=1 Tax=Roseobacter sp. TaxID=1907202 RepID=UPI003299D3A6